MITSKNGKVTLKVNKNLFSLRIENEQEGPEVIVVTLEELLELKQFLSELPLELPDPSTKI